MRIVRLTKETTQNILENLLNISNKEAIFIWLWLNKWKILFEFVGK